MSKGNAKDKNDKVEHLSNFYEDGQEQYLTTNQGLRINDDQNSLKAGERGATLLEDFYLREKITHFDHERIPERVVHARGSGAHGYFQVYESMAPFTKADFLQNPNVKTPVFVRFSTVAGSRGSSDLARDVRGFAVKFYTEEGIYDLVGNNMPVFFIQDAIKFPDLIHAVKPEPHNEIPQAASAHDTFWDFISRMPEATHMMMWVMSDRAIPRSFRMMEGFGVHTFRFINSTGEARFVKFHWKPVLGVHSVVWDEAQKISGKDADFHRRDLWEAIENGDYPEWELGVQMVEEKDEHTFDFDLLDPTKLIPEEIVPVRIIGKLTLNRNPENFFAETEQVAFHPGHIVPGIDFTNDPLLQGRLFSYTDTQLLRLGGPNFNEIPINRPIHSVHNHQRDGHMRQMINRGKVSYDPNSLGGGCPMQAGRDMGGFVSYAEKIDARKVRGRSESFFDHFSQATMFYNSQSEPEQEHLVEALLFELGKVETPQIRERMVYVLSQVDRTLAARIAQGLGIKVHNTIGEPLNMSIPADGIADEYQPKGSKKEKRSSPALSMANTIKNTIKTRKIAVIAADGVNEVSLSAMKKELMAEGAQVKVVAPQLGFVSGSHGEKIKIDFSFLTTSSVLFDAVYIPGGEKSVAALKQEADAMDFIKEMYRHGKGIAVSGAGIELLRGLNLNLVSKAINKGDHMVQEAGVIIDSRDQSDEMAAEFIKVIAKHRDWSRNPKKQAAFG